MLSSFLEYTYYVRAYMHNGNLAVKLTLNPYKGSPQLVTSELAMILSMKGQLEFDPKCTQGVCHCVLTVIFRFFFTFFRFFL
jgi:hypothetical protein